MKNQYQLIEEDPQLINSLTPSTSQQMPPIQPESPPLVPSGPAPLAALQKPEAPAPSVQLPGMPPEMTPDNITPYLNGQKQKLNRFGPDQRLELQNQLNARQNSLGVKTTEGLKGFADALMSGVARAGNPNWQGQFQAQEQQNAQNQIGAFKDAGDLNTKQVESGMTLDRMDPRSPLSKSAQESYAPLFAKLGYAPGKLQTMSAANIDSALQLMAAYGGKEMEAMIKQYELEIERTRLGAAGIKAKSDEKMAAAKELAGKGKDNFTIGGVSIPFTKISSDSSKLGTKYLEDKLKEDSTSYIRTATNPGTGERMGTKDGKNWEPIQ